MIGPAITVTCSSVRLSRRSPSGTIRLRKFRSVGREVDIAIGSSETVQRFAKHTNQKTTVNDVRHVGLSAPRASSIAPSKLRK